MTHIHWQLYWKRWWVLYFNRITDPFGPTIWIVIIGPLQLRWFS